MYNQLNLLIMNHGCNHVSPFNTFQARFKEFGDVGLNLRYIHLYIYVDVHLRYIGSSQKLVSVPG